MPRPRKIDEQSDADNTGNWILLRGILVGETFDLCGADARSERIARERDQRPLHARFGFGK